MEYQLGFIGLGILGFLLGLYRIANGRLSQKVDRETCHTHVDSLHRRIDDSEKHLCDKIDDLKDFIEKNGKESKNKP